MKSREWAGGRKKMVCIPMNSILKKLLKSTEQ